MARGYNKKTLSPHINEMVIEVPSKLLNQAAKIGVSESSCSLFASHAKAKLSNLPMYIQESIPVIRQIRKLEHCSYAVHVNTSRCKSNIMWIEWHFRLLNALSTKRI